MEAHRSKDVLIQGPSIAPQPSFAESCAPFPEQAAESYGFVPTGLWRDREYRQSIRVESKTSVFPSLRSDTDRQQWFNFPHPSAQKRVFPTKYLCAATIELPVASSPSDLHP
jgi:hypothetical protein